jgi:hypothetical protein
MQAAAPQPSPATKAAPSSATSAQEVLPSTDDLVTAMDAVLTLSHALIRGVPWWNQAPTGPH